VTNDESSDSHAKNSSTSQLLQDADVDIVKAFLSLYAPHLSLRAQSLSSKPNSFEP